MVKRGVGKSKGGAKSLDEAEIWIDEEKENLERTKPGTHRFITNFLEGIIKNKKSKRFYIPMVKV